MPKYKYLAVFHPCIMASSSRLDLYYLSTLPADLLGLNVLSHQRREKQENDGDDVFIFYYFLIYWMCVEECVSPPFLLATPLHVCGGLGYLKPWKERKKKNWRPRTPGCTWDLCISVNWNPPVTTLTSFLQIQWLVFTSCSLLASRPAAQNQCEVLRGRRRWNAAVFLSFLWFVVLLTVLV